jgi:hypothetical protein
MAYDNPLTITYTWGLHDFGAGAAAYEFQGPAGKSGRLRHVGITVTETFTADTTPGYVRVGTTADPDAYAQLELGTTAVDNGYFSEANDADAIIEPDLPADTEVEVDFVSPTGGTPAGAGHVFVVVDWF